MKILYVEDNPKDADLASLELAQRAPHIHLEVVGSQQAALACLERHTYDVLLTDMHLPDGDGLALLATVRERSWPLAVVIITGGGDETTAVAALKAGADDYIVKRADYLPLLPQTLEAACARYRDERARHTRPLRVLYAEDNTADVNLTQRHLARHARHIALEVVYSAAEVQARLPRGGPVPDIDVLMLDYRLPGPNALELLRELLQVRRLDIPVVVVTGQGDEELALQVLRLGASDYVVKNPGYLYKLPSVLENAFHRAQLQREQAALRQSESRYRTLVEQIPAITYMASLDEPSRLQYISPQAEHILGYSPADYAAQPELWRQQLHPDDSAWVVDHIRRCRETGQPLRLEYRVMHRAGRVLWLRNDAVIVRGPGEQPLCLQGVLVDLTERKQSEAMLRQTNEALATIIEASPLAIAALNAEGCATMWNPAAERLFGWAANEVLGRRLPIIPPEESHGAAPEFARTGQRQAGVELRRLHRSGTLVEVSLWSAPLRDADGQVSGLMALYADIGERLRAEAERERLHREVQSANERLQALSQRLLDVQESERRHLARELHDEIGQQLTGLKLILDMNAFPPGKPVRTSLVEAQELLGELMQQIRELSLSLRPAMLDDLGLLPALIWHLERYTTQTGVQVSFQHRGLEGRRLAPAVETAAYRIVQEALTNVARYAGVKQANVWLWSQPDRLELEVTDEGVGFDPDAVLAAAQSNGLAGMSERATLLGGQFKIESTRGQGTRLTATLPLAVAQGELGPGEAGA